MNQQNEIKRTTTPMTYLQSPSGKPFPRVPFLDSQTWLSKSKEFYDQGVIAQFKRAFKSYFCPSKNNKKVGRRCMKFSSTQIQVSWYKCARCPILTQIQVCSMSYFNPNTSLLIQACSMSYFNPNTSVLDVLF